MVHVLVIKRNSVDIISLSLTVAYKKNWIQDIRDTLHRYPSTI